MELGQLTDIDIGNIFSEKFAWLGGMGPKSRTKNGRNKL